MWLWQSIRTLMSTLTHPSSRHRDILSPSGEPLTSGLIWAVARHFLRVGATSDTILGPRQVVKFFDFETGELNRDIQLHRYQIGMFDPGIHESSHSNYLFDVRRGRPHNFLLDPRFSYHSMAKPSREGFGIRREELYTSHSLPTADALRFGDEDEDAPAACNSFHRNQPVDLDPHCFSWPIFFVKNPYLSPLSSRLNMTEGGWQTFEPLNWDDVNVSWLTSWDGLESFETIFPGELNRLTCEVSLEMAKLAKRGVMAIYVGMVNIQHSLHRGATPADIQRTFRLHHLCCRAKANEVDLNQRLFLRPHTYPLELDREMTRFSQNSTEMNRLRVNMRLPDSGFMGYRSYRPGYWWDEAAEHTGPVYY